MSAVTLSELGINRLPASKLPKCLATKSLIGSVKGSLSAKLNGLVA
jgi:hypothetical protein